MMDRSKHGSTGSIKVLSITPRNVLFTDYMLHIKLGQGQKSQSTFRFWLGTFIEQVLATVKIQSFIEQILATVKIQSTGAAE
jgi:hypothetical protein